MTKKIFVFIVVFLISLYLARAQLVSINFNLNNNLTYESPIIYSKNIVLQVITNERALCRFSNSKGVSFDYMNGLFDENYETIHKKTISNMEDGVYRFYIKCRDINNLNNASLGNNELEAIIKISRPIEGRVKIEGSSILKAGKYSVKLMTTKVPLGEPKLSYTLDGISYVPIVLKGSGKEWEGFLFISENSKEGFGSFKFEAQDLENRKGTELSGDVTFFVDTTSPKMINSFNAIGRYGEIELKWYLDDDVKSFLIYRSEQRGVSEADFYVEVSGSRDYFIDTNVNKGKTYYYKISSKDEAGNVGPLSREVESTTLLESNQNAQQGGLSPSLRAYVDSLLIEIDNFENELKLIEQKNRNEKEKKIYEEVGLKAEVENIKSEIDYLKKEVNGYKLQDLTKEILDTKIGSSSVKLNMLKKRLPEKIIILEEKELENKLSDELAKKILLEYYEDISESLISKKIKSINNFIQEKKVKIRTNVFLFEVSYFDGTKKEFSYFEHSIDSIAEQNSNFRIFLSIPFDFSSYKIKFNNRDFKTEKEDLFSFSSDTKSIRYYIDKKIDIRQINDLVISFIDVSNQNEEKKILTGYSILNFFDNAKTNLAEIMIVLSVILGAYLIYIRRSKSNNEEFLKEFIDKIKMVKELQKQGRYQEANEIYDSLKVDYLSMSNYEKKKVFNYIKELRKQQIT